MKTSSHIPTEPVERQHFKKSYLERKLQEKEAENEIRNYTYSAESETLPKAPDVDEAGKL
ncbi:hypothetical protein UFOVP249_51 [uncultured Caudovirales phage]|uniref:Uncharacterized protein n=1 Tax=uncultured Caudovirales phage TaxID=2100421 RepID=A0A6J5LFK0_9CAUD|nr:hypothetical protein UFOVP249_51 [uncultured Caudovirales phage]